VSLNRVLSLALAFLIYNKQTSPPGLVPVSVRGQMAPDLTGVFRVVQQMVPDLTGVFEGVHQRPVPVDRTPVRSRWTHLCVHVFITNPKD
jgi:hypothetical protein